MLVALLVAIGAAIYFVGTQAEFVGTQGAAGEPPARLAVQIDTPPPLVAAPGWPFQQLPLVAKFTIPVPRVGLVTSTALLPRVFEPVAIPRLPFPPPPGPAVPDDLSPLWLLSPLAAGAFIGGADAVVESVIPEPATLLLLSTGLLLLGLLARRG